MAVNRNRPHGSLAGYKYSNRGELSRGQAAVSCQRKMVRQPSRVLLACGRHSGETEAGAAGGLGLLAELPGMLLGRKLCPDVARDHRERELVGMGKANLGFSKCGSTGHCRLGH